MPQIENRYAIDKVIAQHFVLSTWMCLESIMLSNIHQWERDAEYFSCTGYKEAKQVYDIMYKAKETENSFFSRKLTKGDKRAREDRRIVTGKPCLQFDIGVVLEMC